MTEHADQDARHAAVREARDAWLSPGDHDQMVLAAVQDGLLAVPVSAPMTSWFGLPHQRTSRESGSGLQRRR